MHRNNATTRKGKPKARGVDPLVRAQVAKDIEHFGGIQLFDKGIKQALDKILNNKDKYDQKLYGRGTPGRRSIRNLVDDWKRYPNEVYLERVVIPYIF